MNCPVIQILRPARWLIFYLLIGGLMVLGCSPSSLPSLDAPGQTATSRQANTPTAVRDVSDPTPTLTPQIPTATPSLTPSPTLSPTLEPPTPPPTEMPGQFVIGSSVEGRPLEVWRFGSGRIQRMIVAGIHGGYEWNTVALADELIAYLEAHPELVPEEKSLFILRNMNPDGEARDHGPDGRANANGVDLNRNFPLSWERTWRRSGCWQERILTAGNGPASEPESQALIYFIQSHPIDALISYHSAGLGIFPGGKPLDVASVSLAKAIAAVSEYQYPPVDTGCIYTGMLANWASAQGIASVDLELNNHHDTEFQVNLAILAAFLNWQP